MSAKDILERVQKYKRTGEGKWIATCPAHNDLSPSLSVSETPEGKVLLKCWSGCGALDIITAIGLDWSVLFPPNDNYRAMSRPKRDDLEDFVVELAEYAKKSGQRLSDADKARYAQALKRGGQKNGFVSTVVAEVLIGEADQLLRGME